MKKSKAGTLYDPEALEEVKAQLKGAEFDVLQDTQLSLKIFGLNGTYILSTKKGLKGRTGQRRDDPDLIKIIPMPSHPLHNRMFRYKLNSTDVEQVLTVIDDFAANLPKEY